MSIRPTDIKEPVYEAEPDIIESEIKKKELKINYILLITFLSLDLLITIIIILHESNVFNKNEIDLVFLLINIITFTAFSIFVFISISLFKEGLAKLVKFLHIILTMLYLGYLLVKKIIYFAKNFKSIGVFDVLFIFLLLITIIPRVLFYAYIKKYIVILREKNDCQRGEEHEDFRQNLEIKMERGDNTNWSKTSLPADKRTSN